MKTLSMTTSSFDEIREEHESLKDLKNNDDNKNNNKNDDDANEVFLHNQETHCLTHHAQINGALSSLREVA